MFAPADRPHPKRAAGSSPRAAFTLVELLVVIAIIGILAVMLTVALPGYLQNSKKVVSAQNLKSWYTGFSKATGENDGTMPSPGWDGQAMNRNDETAWFNQIPHALGMNQLKDFYGRVDEPKVGEASIWWNPVVTAKYKTVGKFLFCYGFNERMVEGQGNDQRPMKLAAIKYPQLTVLMGEKADSDPHLNFRNVAAFWGSGLPFEKGDPENQCNFLFVDGHVESFKRSYFSNQSLTLVEDAVRKLETRMTFDIVED
jgi:prepilin-type N-terminal cleavage/methylation domain-containing protein/prepilin-type processing-associated H-X9-DG protein